MKVRKAYIHWERSASIGTRKTGSPQHAEKSHSEQIWIKDLNSKIQKILKGSFRIQA